MPTCGKIIRLEVHGNGNTGRGIYSVGDYIPFAKREIAEINDIGIQSENDNIFLGYDLVDKDGKAIARFENGTYITWFTES